MLTWIREKFGTVVIAGVIVLVGFVFVVSGVFNPKATRGLHEGAVAGTVNGEAISLDEFSNAFRRKTEFFKGMAGGKLNEDQIKQFRLKESTFQELVQRKLMAQEAKRQGLLPSTEEIRDKIQEIQAFKKDGVFDLQTYKLVLQQYNYTPKSFERSLTEDIAVQRWDQYFRKRIRVSDEEIKRQFLVSNDKRNVKYVLLTPETGKKGVSVSAEELKKFWADTSKANLAKSHFDARKERDYKGKTFDDVKDTIAKDLLAGEKIDEIRKINEKLADQVAGLLTANAASDKKINEVLKPYGAEVKTAKDITRNNPYLPGLGEASELMKDAFAKNSKIDAASGGKAKKYASPAWTLVALVTETVKPDVAKLETQREQILQQISYRKERGLMDEWMKKISKKADVEPNPSIVGDYNDVTAGG